MLVDNTNKRRSNAGQNAKKRLNQSIAEEPEKLKQGHHDLRRELSVASNLSSSSFCSTRVEYQNKYVYIAKFKVLKDCPKRLAETELDIGISFMDVNDRVYVRHVSPDSAAAAAGVNPKDRLQFAFLSRQTQSELSPDNLEEEKDKDDIRMTNNLDAYEHHTDYAARAKAALFMERNGSRTTNEELHEMLKVGKFYDRPPEDPKKRQSTHKSRRESIFAVPEAILRATSACFDSPYTARKQITAGEAIPSEEMQIRGDTADESAANQIMSALSSCSSLSECCEGDEGEESDDDDEEKADRNNEKKDEKMLSKELLPSNRLQKQEQTQYDMFTLTCVFQKSKGSMQSERDCNKACNTGVGQVGTWFDFVDIVSCATAC